MSVVLRSIRRPDLREDLVLPTLLFAAIGGMTWAVRGCSGFGGSAGCIFAGVTWGAAWWYLARSGNDERRRPYASGWVILALAMGIGFSGSRGWMQWASFFEGKLYTNYPAGEFVPIDKRYGFLWLFLAGAPWAGIGACLLAWCGPSRETRVWHWGARVALGILGGVFAAFLFRRFPQFFLPLYESLAERYQDFERNPNLRRLINDCRSALVHLGIYLGLLLFELGRREWRSVLLILTVGVVNGVGWALCQNWKWAPNFWPGAHFNWWRCWESSGGISIGIAYGLAFFLANRPMTDSQRNLVRSQRSLEGPNLEWLAVYIALLALAGVLVVPSARTWGIAALLILVAFGVVFHVRGKRETTARSSLADGDPNLERLGVWLGVLFGLGFSIRNGLKGWFNIYRGNEEYWSAILWQILGPIYILCLLAVCGWVLLRPLPRTFQGDRFPRAGAILALVLLVQNGIALLVTGPLSEWNEFAFVIYYLLLFAISALAASCHGRGSRATFKEAGGVLA